MTREKILVADDEPYVLDVCRRILEKNYDVKIVRSGLEAIQIAQYEKFDLLLTDIKMPGIDGLETARELKKINPDTVCITMTGFSTMETAIKALRLGVDEFVIKPFTPEELTLAIERALEKGRLREENIRLKSLLPLFEFNKSLIATTDTDLLLEQVLDRARSETKSSGAAIYLVDGQGALTLWKQIGLFPEQVVSIGADGLSLLEQAKKELIHLELGRSKSWDVDQVLGALSVKSMVALPLMGKHKLLGILMLLKSRRSFSHSELNFLSVMTGQFAVAYENARLFEDLQSAYDQLKSLDYLKSEFINIAAHELRTPLAILMGYASVIEEELEGPHKDYMASIVRNALRLRSLIDDLLNMRTIESGQLQLDVEPIALGKIVSQAISDMSLLARKKNITIDLKLPDNLPVIKSDSQKLELVLMNLLGNAIKFTPPEGKICIEGHRQANVVELSVIDTGVGIAKSEFTKIFDRFYQVENSLNREHEGIGLGLSIVKGILKQVGGEIWVESEVGKGSKFTFTLPCT